MYEPIRTNSVHTVAAPTIPRRTRDEELEFQLAGHLAALLTVTDELLAVAPSSDLGHAAELLSAHIERLRHGKAPLRIQPAAVTGDTAEDRVTALHRRAHALAGRALVVAASRQDTTGAVLSAQRMDAHQAALTAA
ncbi:SCO4983 family protein [Actinacidiphila oryziradicis]|jgi:hypothetical protein|uniref:Uncharacterized protein n=1 Tax=Actinacidiphila oryziradicis TaxID=2571141 RepID=A0A4U0S4N8_9ACTN|nr:hypothetical protein [Actinacidiphila oryziradicis]MDX6332066.1 hypothetical protein [Streptomycetaceae bacterium]TKA03218.1 hypothetical protein FCI23_36820 [Actinacidiphila oryziradicis]